MVAWKKPRRAASRKPASARTLEFLKLQLIASHCRAELFAEARELLASGHHVAARTVLGQAAKIDERLRELQAVVPAPSAPDRGRLN